jgi:hypothetical protein
VRNNGDVFRWAEHTGELELEIEASGERGVYAAAVEAIAELLGAEWGQHAAHEPGKDVETVVEVVPRAPAGRRGRRTEADRRHQGVRGC